MKAIIFILFLVICSQAFARKQIETNDEAYERRSSENYEHYQERGAPLGGYRERLGDTGGAARPGYKGGY